MRQFEVDECSRTAMLTLRDHSIIVEDEHDADFEFCRKEKMLAFRTEGRSRLPILKLVVRSVGQVNVRGKIMRTGIPMFRETSPSPIWIFWISVAESQNSAVVLVSHTFAKDDTHNLGRILLRNRMSRYEAVESRLI